MSQTIRVLIAEDHRIMRKSVSRLVDSQLDLTVVGNASDGAAAVELAQTLRPDVVLMDFDMPEKDGVEATREILQNNPDMVVIGFSMHDEGPAVDAMLQAGAAAHISKSRSTAELLTAIRKSAGCPG